MGWLGIQQWQERKSQSVVPRTIRAVRTVKVITANIQATKTDQWTREKKKYLEGEA